MGLFYNAPEPTRGRLSLSSWCDSTSVDMAAPLFVVCCVWPGQVYYISLFFHFILVHLCFFWNSHGMLRTWADITGVYHNGSMNRHNRQATRCLYVNLTVLQCSTSRADRTYESVDLRCLSSVDSLFQACGAATEKALLLIRQHVEDRICETDEFQAWSEGTVRVKTDRWGDVLIILWYLPGWKHATEDIKNTSLWH